MKSRRFFAVAGSAILCAWFAVTGIAQQAPGSGGGNNAQPPAPQAIVKAGAEGVFVLQGATLTKLNSDTLAQVGVLQLIAKPTTTNSSANQPQTPPPAGVMVVTDAKVLVVIGDQFFSVDAATFMVGAKVTLPKSAQQQTPPSTGTRAGSAARTGGQAGQGGQAQGQQQAPPLPSANLEVQGTTLYITMGPQIIGVNINDGTILGKATLAKPGA